MKKKILELLDERGPGKTICPSDAARAVAPTDARADWEPLMEPARQAARALVAEGKLVVTQRGNEIDLSSAHGPIRLGLKAAAVHQATGSSERASKAYRSRRRLD